MIRGSGKCSYECTYVCKFSLGTSVTTRNSLQITNMLTFLKLSHCLIASNVSFLRLQIWSTYLLILWSIFRCYKNEHKWRMWPMLVLESMRIAMLQHIMGLLLKDLFGSLSDCCNHLSCLCIKCSFYREDVIFNHHEKICLWYYENLKYYCDPWNSHYRQIKKYSLTLVLLPEGT